MGKLDSIARVTVRSRAEWRAWLEKHHAQTDSIWLVTYKKASGPLHVPYDSIVEEALCFGWIDGLPRKLDDKRSMLLLSPRRPSSAWSKINKERVERLLAAGLMHPAGLRAVEQAKSDGTWSALDGVETLQVPEDLGAALSRNRTAAAFFAAFPPSSRRGILEWIASAKRPETRAKRIAETVALAERNVKANHPAGRNAGPRPRPRGTSAGSG